MSEGQQSPKQEPKSSGFTSFWNELKRRKVVRVAIVYAVVAWLLAQVAITVFPHVGLPHWTPTLVIWILIIGFPIALIFAWAFEVTPEGINVDAEVRASGSVADAKGNKLNYITLGLVVLVLTFLVVDRYLFDAQTKSMPVPVSPPRERPVVAGTINLPNGSNLAEGVGSIGFEIPKIALSPDGEWLVYVGDYESGSRLYRKHLDGFDDPEPIPRTEGAIYAFFSPNGQSIGFLTNNRLKRLSIEGDDLRTLATLSSPFRAFWTEQDLIYFVDNEGLLLKRVSASGGEVETIYDRGYYRYFTDVLPDGRFAFLTQKARSISGDYASISCLDLLTGEVRSLGVTGYDARWVSTGHLIFGRSGNLMAVRFDSERGVVLDEPLPLVDNVAMDSFFINMHLAVSIGGTLAYIPGTDLGIGKIVTVDRQGNERQFPMIPPNHYGALDLSSNDGSIAVQVADLKDYIWIYDLEREEGRKLSGSDDYGWPKWDRKGNTLALSTLYNSEGEFNLLKLPLESGSAQLIKPTPQAWVFVSDWSPNGEELAVHSRRNVGFISISKGNSLRYIYTPEEVVRWGAVFSPDGRWIVYTSNETERPEIRIQSYPDGKIRRQISTNGGYEPVWCESGEIFFRWGYQIWSSKVNLEPELVPEPARQAFAVTDFIDTDGRSYDVSSDGQTLFFVKRIEPAIRNRIRVVSNWFEELERLVPTE